MTRHRSVLDLGWTLSDRHRIGDLAAPIIVLSFGLPSAHRPLRAQHLHQLFLQQPPGLHEQASIDGLVRHVIRLVLRVGALEPTGYLLR